MRVMVSLNLADIMTAIRPRTSQPVYETANNEVAAADPDQESSRPTNSEPITNAGESICGDACI